MEYVTSIFVYTSVAMATQRRRFRDAAKHYSLKIFPNSEACFLVLQECSGKILFTKMFITEKYSAPKNVQSNNFVIAILLNCKPTDTFFSFYCNKDSASFSCQS